MKYCPEPETIAMLAGGDLEKHVAEQVRGHLSECSECRELEAELSADAKVLALGPEPAEASIERVRARVLYRTQAGPPRWYGWTAAAAAAAAVIFAGWLAVGRPPAELNVALKSPGVVNVPVPKMRDEIARAEPRSAIPRRPVRKVQPVRTDTGEDLLRALDAVIAPAGKAVPYRGDVVVAMQTADPDVIILLLPEGD